MKKVILTGFLGIAFTFAMVSCNGSANSNDSVDNQQPACEQAEEHECMHHCQATCPDSVCLANNCENCTCPEDSPCHKKEACKGDGSCCKDKAAEGCCKDKAAEGCCKDKAAEGCCKDKGNGECKKHAENK